MALKYIGDGTYFPGVPARDLTDDEEAQFGAFIAEQQHFAGRVLYEPVKKESGKPQGKPQEDKG